MSDGTLFGLIHDLKDRARTRKIKDARRNFLTAPEEAINEVAQIDVDEALRMRDYVEQRNTALAAAEAQKQKTEGERYRSALTGVAQALRASRDDPNSDLLVDFDSLAPLFQNGFRMSPEEITTWRTALATDPTILDNLAAGVMDPDDLKPNIVSAGADLVDNSGRVLHSNKGAVKPIQVKRGDGGVDVYLADDDGNFITPGQRPAGGGGAVSGVPRGIRNNNHGNLKDGPWARKQAGYIGSDGTFAKFETPEAGIAAQENLLRQHYVNGKRSVTDIVMKYLGGPDNPENSKESQQNYIRYVAGELGIDPTAPVPVAKLEPLAEAMREFENGQQGDGPRPAVSSAGGGKGYRTMTSEEVEAAGLDPKRVYQIGVGGANKGKIIEVPGQPKAENVKEQANQVRATVTALQDTRDLARRVRTSPAFKQATGSIQGLLPSIFQDTVDFDKDLKALQGRVVVDALIQMKRDSPNGATGFGQLNKTEGEWIKYSQGAYDPRSPDVLRRNTRDLEKDAMMSIGLSLGVPEAAVSYLIENRETAQQFDEKYGAGVAATILGE